MTDWDDVLRITLWDADFATLGWIGEWDALDVTARAIGAGTATWTCPADGTAAAKLLTPGCRATVDYRPPGSGLPWTQVASGRVIAQTSGPAATATTTVSLIDHWSTFGVLAWPLPAAAISAQTVASWTASGPGEDVLTALVAATAARLGLPLTVPASLHRGDPVNVDTRFGKVADVAAQIAAQAGITARVRQVSGGLQLDVGVGADRRGIVLSESADTVSDWTWSITPPSLTRVVVGGHGTGTSRTLVAVADTTAEDLWGVALEDFVDGPDTTDATQLAAAGTAALAAAGARIDGLRITLRESQTWRYCAGVREGDAVRVELLPGLSRDTTVTEVRLTASTDAGLAITPVIGDPTVGLPERVQAQIIAGLARGLATLRAR